MVRKIGFHFGDGLGKRLFSFLNLCELFIKGGYVLLAALHNGRENLGGLLGAVGQLTDQALVDAELHSLLNVGGVGFHIGDLSLEGSDQVVNGSFRRSVQLIKKAELSVYALHSGVIAFLIGRLEGLHFCGYVLHAGGHFLGFCGGLRLFLAVFPGRLLQFRDLRGVFLLGGGEFVNIILERPGVPGARFLCGV